MAARKKTVKRKAPPTPKISNSMGAQEKRWRAEDDVRTLMRAEEIKNDRGRMEMARKVAAKQAKEAASVAGKLSTTKGKRS